MRKFCEILAPIADVKFAKKLIRAGATALYCGLEGFSSRPKSSDMTVDDIIEVKKISLKFNVKDIGVCASIRRQKTTKITREELLATKTLLTIVHFNQGEYKVKRISGGGEGVESNSSKIKDENLIQWQSINA